MAAVRLMFALFEDGILAEYDPQVTLASLTHQRLSMVKPLRGSTIVQL